MSNHRTDLTSLVVLACAYGVYGWVVANTPMNIGEALGLIVGFYIAFTVVIIVAHVAMALLFFWAPARKDAEREKRHPPSRRAQWLRRDLRRRLGSAVPARPPAGRNLDRARRGRADGAGRDRAPCLAGSLSGLGRRTESARSDGLGGAGP